MLTRNVKPSMAGSPAIQDDTAQGRAPLAPWASWLPLAPKVRPDGLDLRAEAGRPVDAASTAKGRAAASQCQTLLEGYFPGATVACAPSFPLGYSATVPLKASVVSPDGTAARYFLKFCDAHAGILNQVHKEFDWMQAIAPAGISPLGVLFNRADRILVSGCAPGIPVDKGLMAQPAMLRQVARAARAIHELPPGALPGIKYFKIRPVADALFEAVQGNLLNRQHAESWQQCADRLDAATQALPALERPVHGDFTANNMLLDITTQKLSVIDYGMAHFSDPMTDLAFFIVSAQLPGKVMGELLSIYTEGDAKGLGDLEERLQLHVAYTRLERYVRYLIWTPTDHRMHVNMAWLLHDDLRRLNLFS